ncbi:hypothetical protein D3C72_2266820 [compost metagenome]
MLDTDTGGGHVFQDVALQAGKRHHQIRLDGEDLLQLAAGKAADLGLVLARLGRVDGKAGDAGDQVLRAEQVQRFDGFGAQAGNALVVAHGGLGGRLLG